jgi:septal ring factor EnvC (AmiA/AmiB activator)
MYNSEMGRLTQTIKKINFDIVSNNAKLQKLQSDQSSFQAQIGDLETDISQLSLEIRSLAEIMELIQQNLPRLEKARNCGEALHAKVKMDHELELDEGEQFFIISNLYSLAFPVLT